MLPVREKETRDSLEGMTPSPMRVRDQRRKGQRSNISVLLCFSKETGHFPTVLEHWMAEKEEFLLLSEVFKTNLISLYFYHEYVCLIMIELLPFRRDFFYIYMFFVSVCMYVQMYHKCTGGGDRANFRNPLSPAMWVSGIEHRP